MKYDKQGRELPDPTPIEIPAGFNRPPTLAEQIERCFRTIVSRNAAQRGHETFEEANDFEPDETDPTEQDTAYTDMGVDLGLPTAADATHGTAPPAAGGGASAGAGAAAAKSAAGSADAAGGGGTANETGSSGSAGGVGGQPDKRPVGGSPAAR